MLEMRRVVKEGFLGGRPIHLESYWSYDFGDTNYVGPVLGNRDHWVRQLPGQLFHNIISHGIAKLAEFLDDEHDRNCLDRASERATSAASAHKRSWMN